MPVFIETASTLILVGIFLVVVFTGIGIGMITMKAGFSGTETFTLIRLAGLENWKIPWFALPLGPALLCRVPFGVARRFGKGRLFGFGLLLLPFVFFPILGFGRAKYLPVARPPDGAKV